MSQNVKRKFTEEVKREAVKLIEEQGRPVADVARSLDVHRSQVDRWRQQFGKSEQVSGAGATASGDRKELNRLKVENKQLRMERDILNKAAAFFAKELS